MQSRYLSLGLLALLGALNLSLPKTVSAQVTAAPSLLNFQGRLARPDGTPVADGTYSLRFSLHDAATGGAEKWNQTINPVAVKNGAFAVLLNTNTANLFSGDLYLEIKIGTDAPLTPRQQLVSVAYAMKANSVPDGSIGSAQIANGAITSDKLANGTLNSLSWLLGGNAGTTTANFLGTTDNNPLIFRTNNAERMRLLANGNLGIGTNNPGMSLEAMTPSYYSAPAIGASFSASRWGYLHVGPSDPALVWNTGSALRFGVEPSRGTGYAELMRLTSDGKLALGTAAATSPLTFRNADERKITFWETSDNNNKFYGIDMAGGGRIRHWAGVGGSFEVGHYNTTDNSFIERLRVNGNGNVGIGTANPSALLDVNGLIRSNGVSLRNGSDLTFSGNGGDAGDLIFATSAGAQRARIYTDGSANKLYLTTQANNAPNLAIDAAGNVGLGTSTPAAKLDVVGTTRTSVLTITGGSDIAEPFDVSGDTAVLPGMVVTIDEKQVGKLCLATSAYDQAVAGIISGANGINPGVTLTQEGTVADGKHPIAMSGRVWCYVDADANGAVKPGDLLTTSNTPGHAMRANDTARSHGTILGKAMSPLAKGKGLVLVLVNLH